MLTSLYCRPGYNHEKVHSTNYHCKDHETYHLSYSNNKADDNYGHNYHSEY